MEQKCKINAIRVEFKILNTFSTIKNMSIYEKNRNELKCILWEKLIVSTRVKRIIDTRFGPHLNYHNRSKPNLCNTLYY